jgi:hypothetical protein
LEREKGGKNERKTKPGNLDWGNHEAFYNE